MKIKRNLKRRRHEEVLKVMVAHEVEITFPSTEK